MRLKIIAHRCLLAASFVIASMGLAKAQPNGRTDIVVHFGGPGSDGANTIVSMANGGYALAGWKAKDGSRQDTESWLIRVDARGNVLWDLPFPSSAPYGITALAPALDGGLFAVDGASGSLAGRTRVTKVSYNGVIEDQISVGNRPEDTITAIRPTFDGGLIAAGRTTYKTHGRSDGWIIKLTRNFDVEWFRTLGSPFDDGLEDVTHSQNGGYIAAGWTTLPDDEVMGWLISLDTNGALLDDRRCSLGPNTEFHRVAIPPASRGVFAATVNAKTGGGRQFVIGEFGDDTGTRWRQTIGAGLTALASDLTMSADGTYLVSATISDTTGQAGLVVNFNSDGRILFANRHAEDAEVQALAIAPRRPNGYALAGTSKRSTGLDQDVWLLIRSGAEITGLTTQEMVP